MPQVLKDEIRQSIIESALDVFVEKGYKDASMKEIASSSNIAVGNIYNYFKDKEALYNTLAEPVFLKILNIFNTAPKAPINLSVDKKIDEFIEIYKNHKKIFVMLLEKSCSPGFDSLKETVIDKLSSAIIIIKKAIPPFGATDIDKIQIRTFTGAYISGIISILTQKISEDIKIEILHDFLRYMKKALISKFSFIGRDII